MEFKHGDEAWPSTSAPRTVPASGLSIVNPQATYPQVRGEPSTRATVPPRVQPLRHSSGIVIVHPITNKPPPAIRQRPPLKKERSLRRPVMERRLLTSNGLISHNTITHIEMKSSDRLFNPHKKFIVEEGRRRSSGGSVSGEGGSVVANNPALPRPITSTNGKGHTQAGSGRSLVRATSNSLRGSALPRSPNQTQTGQNTKSILVGPQSPMNMDTVRPSINQRQVVSGYGAGFSTGDTLRRMARNSPLVRGKTAFWMTTKYKPTPTARVLSPGLTRQKTVFMSPSKSDAPSASQRDTTPQPPTNPSSSPQKTVPSVVLAGDDVPALCNDKAPQPSENNSPSPQKTEHSPVPTVDVAPALQSPASTNLSRQKTESSIAPACNTETVPTLNDNKTSRPPTKSGLSCQKTEHAISPASSVVPAVCNDKALQPPATSTNLSRQKTEDSISPTVNAVPTIQPPANISLPRQKTRTFIGPASNTVDTLNDDKTSRPPTNTSLARKKTKALIAPASNAVQAPVFDNDKISRPPAGKDLSRQKTEHSIAPTANATPAPQPPAVTSLPRQKTRTFIGPASNTVRNLNDDKTSRLPIDTSLARKKTKSLIAPSSNAVQASKLSANNSLSRKKSKPFISDLKSSPPLPPSPPSPKKRNVSLAHGEPTSNQFNSPPQNAPLTREKPTVLFKLPSRISPPRVSKPAVTSTTVSGQVVPHRRASNSTSTYQNMDIDKRIKETRSGNERGCRSNDSEEGDSPMLSDDGRDDNRENREDHESNDSDEEEEEEEEDADVDMTDSESEYDELAHFNDFFPDDKIELPPSIANFNFTQIYSETPPEGFTGTTVEWLEMMLDGLDKEVAVLAKLAQYTKMRANNAYKETVLAEDELYEATKQVEELERGLRETGGEECWRSYQLALARRGVGDGPEDVSPEPMDMETDSEEEPRMTSMEQIVPKEKKADNGEHVIASPLSNDDTGNARRETGPQPESACREETRATSKVSPSVTQGTNSHLDFPALPTTSKKGRPSTPAVPKDHVPTIIASRASRSPTTPPVSSPQTSAPKHTDDPQVVPSSTPVPEAAVVHGYKRSHEDDSLSDHSDDDNDSRSLHRKSDHSNKGSVGRDDRPVVKRMRFYEPSSSGNSSDDQKLEGSSTNLNTKRIATTGTLDDDSPQPQVIMKEEAVDVGVPPLPQNPAQPRSSSLSPTQSQSQPQTTPKVHPKPKTRPPIPEHEIIDVDTYEFTEKSDVPATTNQEAGSNTIVIPRRRTVPRPSVRYSSRSARGPRLGDNAGDSGNKKAEDFRGGLSDEQKR